jgi:ATP-binding cassette subfamily F protein 3
MLNIQNISYEIGGKEILKNINQRINNNEKIGLVGVNGAGKSTLLKIVTGKIQPDIGNIEMKGNISYLAQEIHKEISFNTDENLTIGEYLIIEKGLDIQEWEINKLINHLNMSDKDSDSLISELSGGQKVKVEIIKILLEQPDLLVLDEPTNFLDIPSAEWLMKYLLDYPKAVLVVSHDLRLMNRGINRIWYLNNLTHQIDDYKGNYSAFLKAKGLKEDWIKKNIKKDLREADRLEASAAILAKRGTSGEKKRELLKKDKQMKMSLPEIKRSSIKVLEVNNISKEYVEDEKILKNVSFEIERGDKLVIIGKNGVGKTTLLKVLANKIPATSGTFEWGYNTEVGYYAQEYEGLDYNQTVLENVFGMEELNWSDVIWRSFLGAFLIFGDMVNQKVGTLSGGEKTRLALAKLFAKGYNVLLLDEPTTYLDPASQDILIDVLKQYKGTLIVVSHEPKFVKDLEFEKVLLMPEEKYGYFKEEYLDRVGIV